MFTAASHDPFFYDRARRAEPRLHANHRELIRRAHAAEVETLEVLDAELAALAARRRTAVERVAAYRDRLWERSARRYHQRSWAPGETPIPPPIADAEPLDGAALRRVALSILSRHGTQPLSEIRGLIHRYGYVVAGRRPVQRLADALAHEMRAGRAIRHARGVYGPSEATIPALQRRRARVGDPSLDEAPRPWQTPDIGAHAPVDVTVADDPQRWSMNAWTDHDQGGRGFLAVDEADEVAAAADRELLAEAEERDEIIALARARTAQLIVEREGPPPTALSARRRRPEPTEPARPPEPTPPAAEPAQPASDSAPPISDPTPPTSDPTPPSPRLGNDSSTNRSLRGGGEDPTRGKTTPKNRWGRWRRRRRG